MTNVLACVEDCRSYTLIQAVGSPRDPSDISPPDLDRDHLGVDMLDGHTGRQGPALALRHWAFR